MISSQGWVSSGSVGSMAVIVVPLLRRVATACNAKAELVIAYCAQDQDYAEPILREFEKANRHQSPRGL